MADGAEPDASGRAPTLTLALDGWEGPLDVLLALARAQKIDLATISILALVDQYLAFIAEARALRLELAADYLVMAAWLAYLKSCLLLPSDPAADPDPQALALALQSRLQRLDAMRDAGARLMGRDRVGHDVFTRARPEGLHLHPGTAFDCDLFSLLAAYGAVRARCDRPVYAVAPRAVLALDSALERLRRLLGTVPGWAELARYLPPAADEAYRRSALASTFLAALELARQGRAELAQADAFGPLLLRARG